jgi:hypothetical protein
MLLINCIFQIYKVEFTFQKSTILEIDLLENELVTVLAKHDEGGNEGEIIFLFILDNSQMAIYFFF